jgi:hypothetical protein
MFNLFLLYQPGLTVCVDEYEMTHSRYAIQVSHHSLPYLTLTLFPRRKNFGDIVSALIASFVYTHLLRNKSIVDPYYIPVLLLQYYKCNMDNVVMFSIRSSHPFYADHLLAQHCTGIQFRTIPQLLWLLATGEEQRQFRIHSHRKNNTLYYVYQVCYFHFLERGTK